MMCVLIFLSILRQCSTFLTARQNRRRSHRSTCGTTPGGLQIFCAHCRTLMICFLQFLLLLVGGHLVDRQLTLLTCQSGGLIPRQFHRSSLLCLFLLLLSTSLPPHHRSLYFSNSFLPSAISDSSSRPRWVNLSCGILICGQKLIKDCYAGKQTNKQTTGPSLKNLLPPLAMSGGAT